MANLTNETVSKANGPAADFRNKVASTEASFEKMTHDLGQKTGAMVSSISDSASEYVKTGRDYVKEHPGRSVAIAAAAGVVAGSLLTLISRRRRE